MGYKFNPFSRNLDDVGNYTTAMIRGQISKMDTGTVDITTQGVYVSTGLTATLDTATANGLVLGTTDAFGLKSTNATSKLLRFYGSIDARTATGNNKILGVKLALNGVPIDATECRAYTGSSNEEAKLITSWMIEVDENDEVSLFMANHSSDVDIDFRRGRIVASEVFA
jgi:hypothetical protein